MKSRLIANWVYGGFLAGLLLLFLSPLIVHLWAPALAATFLSLPIYMLHQYEEHDDDRFRRAVNRIVGNGHDVLSPGAVFLINVPGVWGVIAVSLWLAAKVNPGFASIALYLVLVNAVVHIATAVILRAYNPGLITAVVLFLPLAGVGIWEVQRAGGTTLMQITGFVIAIAIHLLILTYALRKKGIAEAAANLEKI